MIPDFWNGKPYYSLDSYLKKTYGTKMYKIALNGGMTCPNRDGTLDTRGCIFCSAGGSGEFTPDRIGSIASQLTAGKALLQNKNAGDKCIAYFQSYTNTYAPISTLCHLYTEALMESSVQGISIATRPDCVKESVVNLLTSLKKQFPDKFVWIELGLQTIHEHTASYIRRGYEIPMFEDCVNRLRAKSVPVIVHTILGLPGETTEMILQTINYVNLIRADGIKLQLLHVLKGTDLELDYVNHKFSVLSLEEYLNLLIKCIECLSPEIVIHRITGDGPRNLLIAPVWSLNKKNVLNSLHKTMKERNAWQGKIYVE